MSRKDHKIVTTFNDQNISLKIVPLLFETFFLISKIVNVIQMTLGDSPCILELFPYISFIDYICIQVFRFYRFSL